MLARQRAEDEERRVRWVKAAPAHRPLPDTRPHTGSRPILVRRSHTPAPRTRPDHMITMSNEPLPGKAH